MRQNLAMCVNVCIDMCVDMRVDMCRARRIDMRTDVCTDMGEEEPGHACPCTCQCACLQQEETRVHTCVCLRSKTGVVYRRLYRHARTHGRKRVQTICTARRASSALRGTCHNYIGHNSIGHSYVGHNYIGHNYIGEKLHRRKTT